MLGLSVCRNPKLANIFYRLKLIEAYGTGIQKIMKSYEGSEKTPTIQTTENAFKITLPNLNENPKEIMNKTMNNDTNHTIELTPHTGLDGRILELARRNGLITRRDVERLAGLKQTAAGQLLSGMVQAGMLIQTGKGKNTRYTLPQN